MHVEGDPFLVAGVTILMTAISWKASLVGSPSPLSKTDTKGWIVAFDKYQTLSGEGSSDNNRKKNPYLSAPSICCMWTMMSTYIYQSHYVCLKKSFKIRSHMSIFCSKWRSYFFQKQISLPLLHKLVTSYFVLCILLTNYFLSGTRKLLFILHYYFSSELSRSVKVSFRNNGTHQKMLLP